MSEYVRRPKWHADLLALVMVAAVVALTLVFPPLKQRGTMVLFTGAVAVAAWYGGWRPALIATCTSVLFVAWYVLPPHNSPWITDPWDWARLATFVLVAVVISSLYTARERAEERLRTSEQRLMTALEYANMGAWEMDMSTGQFWWSPGLEQILGRAPGSFSLTYEGFIAYVHPEDRDFVERAVTHTLDRGTSFSIEHRIVRPDQAVRRVNTRGRIFYGASGRCERIVAVAVDVTSDAGGEPPQAAAQVGAAVGANSARA